MIKKHRLHCCALCQISASDRDSIETIRSTINQLQVDAQKEWRPVDRKSGERACFVIVAPGENNLEKNLQTLGFNMVTTFPRRNGYQPGILKMYFLNW